MTSFYNYQPPMQVDLDLLYKRELSLMCRERGISYSGNRDDLMRSLRVWRPPLVLTTPRQLVDRRTPSPTSYQLPTNRLDDERAEREGATPDEVAELKEMYAAAGERETNAYRMVFQQRDTPDGWPEMGPGDDIAGMVKRARSLPTIEYLTRLATHYSHSDNEDIDNGGKKAETIRTAIYHLEQTNDPHTPNVKPVGGRCIPHGGWLWKTIVLWSPWQLYDLDRFVPDETLHLHWETHSRYRRAVVRTQPPRRHHKNAAKGKEVEDEEPMNWASLLEQA